MATNDSSNPSPNSFIDINKKIIPKKKTKKDNKENKCFI